MLRRALLLLALTAAGPLVGPPELVVAGGSSGQLPGCPAPEPDRAQAPAAGTPRLAVAPVRLEASRVDLHRIDIRNSNKIVAVRTRQGTKRVLRFVAGAVEITDLRQSTAADATPSLTVITPAGSKTRLAGPVTLYVERLCGTLTVGPLGIGFGVPGSTLPPISAASPPPVVPAELSFTGATIHTAALFSAQLDLPWSTLIAG